MKLFQRIAALALALTLVVSGTVLAAQQESLVTTDPATGVALYAATLFDVKGKTQGRLGETFTATSYTTHEAYTYGEVGPVDIYEIAPGQAFESEYASYTLLVPLELRTDGALYLDKATQENGDFYTLGIDEASGIGSAFIDREGYYLLRHNTPDMPGNDSLYVLHVTSNPGTPTTEPTQPAENFAGFTDVKASDYYADAVKWAVDNGVTSGTSSTTFSPATTCTRGQVVTFLWRMFGKPAATVNNPFADMDAGDYFYEAALWAYEKGITSGTSATAFSPDKVCSRGEIVTFLWRAAGKPEAAQAMPFTDVAEGSYCYDAVCWAAEKGIATGSGAFNPAGAANRAQTVSFLYRYEG